MGHRPKCNMWNNDTSRIKHRRKSSWPKVKLIFHRYSIKSIIYNKNLITWTGTKLNDLEMTPLRGWKDKHIESITMDTDILPVFSNECFSCICLSQRRTGFFVMPVL